MLINSSILLSEDKENKELLFVQQFVKPGSLVFDVGTHVGAKTDLYLKLNTHVICIEPQPACVKLLTRKYFRNPQVTILNKGVSDSIGTMDLYICSEAPTISTFSEEWQHGRFENYLWDKTVTVSVTTLDEVIKEFGCPYFCKIDVEGYEYNVLMGLSQPIPYISFEFTKELFKNSKLCIRHLKNLGYTLFNYGLGESLELTHREWISAENLIQEIEANPDKFLWGDIYAHQD
jgi:FkbM family methyltransferase